jgi:DNA-directed RNA polymerase subunit L
MNDRDIDAPILFVRLRNGESVHIKGRLALEHEHVSQVCTATTMWHIDPELADRARKEFVDAGNDPRIFDNSLIQRYFSRDERGRPNWFDMYIESVGVIPSKDLLKMAVQILRKKVDTYFKEAIDTIQTESDPNTYSVRLEQGGHTVGYLMQEVMYGDLNIKFVSYDIPHPLRKTMVLRFNTPKKPDAVLKAAKDTIDEYCAVVDKEL